MKRLEPLPPPDCLNNCMAQSRNRKIKYYRNLTDTEGDIYPRWNTTCKEGNPVSRIRKRLAEMSQDCCVYCGQRISNMEMDVDHFLPKSAFPYIAYCWENLLPSCKPCNQSLKQEYVPDALKDRVIVEEILREEMVWDNIYDKSFLLKEIAGHSRLIDPTFDNPEDHLAFNPEFYFYESRTEIGNVTAKRLFNRRKATAENWEQISRFVKKIVMICEEPEEAREIVSAYVDLSGYEYVSHQFCDYWLTEKAANRIHRS